jgi:hypothetical protein
MLIPYGLAIYVAYNHFDMSCSNSSKAIHQLSIWVIIASIIYIILSAVEIIVCVRRTLGYNDSCGNCEIATHFLYTIAIVCLSISGLVILIITHSECPIVDPWRALRTLTIIIICIPWLILFGLLGGNFPDVDCDSD